ncbi:MAG: hypothetical protein QXZ14_08945 [Candidatus Jordarchaeales archaeon]|nr:hypothetical protein [Candidatus Jordarchaeia archaeon]
MRHQNGTSILMRLAEACSAACSRSSLCPLSTTILPSSSMWGTLVTMKPAMATQYSPPPCLTLPTR